MLNDRGFATPLVVIILAIAVLGGIYFVSTSGDTEQADKDAMEVMTGDEHMRDSDVDDDQNMMEGEVMEANDDDSMMMDDGETEMMMNETNFTGTVLAGKRAPLLVFNQTDYEKALREKKVVALYFYANWCPICKKEFPIMGSVFDELMSDDVVGFRVNYNDDETSSDEVALAREFGVAYQHTKVMLKDGERVLKSPESWDKARYSTEINQLLK